MYKKCVKGENGDDDDDDDDDLIECGNYLTSHFMDHAILACAPEHSNHIALRLLCIFHPAR